MSKKTLLSENQVRQFMKYADIGTLADGFVNEMYDGLAEEEEIEAVADIEADLGADLGDELAAEEEVEAEEPAATDEAEIQNLVQAIADAIEGETGVAVNVEGGEDAAPEEEIMEPADEPPLDDEAVADIDLDTEDDLAEMVAERVQRRVKQLARTQRLAEAKAARIDGIADRILARISKGE